jgi:hypothetical protein
MLLKINHKKIFKLIKLMKRKIKEAESQNPTLLIKIKRKKVKNQLKDNRHPLKAKTAEQTVRKRKLVKKNLL